MDERRSHGGTEDPKSRPVPDKLIGHTKKIEAEVYPIPSEMQGGSGYTALEFDRNGKLYVGTANYGFYGSLAQLDPIKHIWKRIFRTDELTHQFARGPALLAKYILNSVLVRMARYTVA